MKRLVAVVVLAVAGVAAAAPRQAKPGEDKVLGFFVGTWEGKGQHMGFPMKATTEYAWVLGKQFLKGESRVQAGDGSFTYEATIHFKPAAKEGEYSVVWLDSMGNIITSTMTAKGNTLTMESMEKTPQGEHPARSEITMGEKGWVDKSMGKKDGKWIEFGSMTFTRK